ncbi:MAG: 2-hydroxychromene-2-carboxylate isomerase [Candidatus Micropelagos thuwalensis]|nr:2-hydroxychromene-2-carboxylate isomerase [Candidatus Micropelagos thuwalensis]
MARLEFFFDISSPWTYLAFSRIEALAERMQAELVWRPILVGGVFNSVNQELYETRANPNKAKLNYSIKDIKDWADFCCVEINWPDIFPVNAVNIMRGAFLALDHDKLPEYARLGFEAYWRDGLDVSHPDTLSGIAEACHLPVNDFLTSLKDDVIKYRLRENTDELCQRGGFGSPTMFINETDMYFGNDRLLLIEEKLKNENLKK